MVALRVAEEGIFLRSTRRCANSRTLAGAGSDAALKGLIQEVDAHVRQIDRTFLDLRQRYHRSLGHTSLGVTVAGLLVLFHDDWAHLFAFIGPYGAEDFVDNLFQRRDALHRLNASDFHSAWRILQLTERR